MIHSTFLTRISLRAAILFQMYFKISEIGLKKIQIHRLYFLFALFD
jgi:hypothetical protein